MTEVSQSAGHQACRRLVTSLRRELRDGLRGVAGCNGTDYTVWYVREDELGIPPSEWENGVAFPQLDRENGGDADELEYVIYTFDDHTVFHFSSTVVPVLPDARDGITLSVDRTGVPLSNVTAAIERALASASVRT